MAIQEIKLQDLNTETFIDEQVKASGRIPPASEIVSWITAAAAKENP